MVLREQGNKSINFRRRREERSTMRETRNNNQCWGTGKIGNKDFSFGKRGDKAIYLYQGNKRTGTSPGITKPTKSHMRATIFRSVCGSAHFNRLSESSLSLSVSKKCSVHGYI